MIAITIAIAALIAAALAWSKYDNYRGERRAAASATVWAAALEEPGVSRRAYRDAVRRIGGRRAGEIADYVQSVRDAHAAAGLPAPRFAQA